MTDIGFELLKNLINLSNAVVTRLNFWMAKIKPNEDDSFYIFEYFKNLKVQIWQ